MRHLRELAEVVRIWAGNEDRVRALLWYGTQALGTFSPFSDIDAAILHRGHASDVVESLRQHLGQRVRECVHVHGRGEAALWVDEALTKIDLRLVADPGELPVQHAGEPRRADDRSIILPRSGGRSGASAGARRQCM